MAQDVMLNPFAASQVITPEEEEETAVELKQEIESLAQLMKQVNEMRQVVAVEARRADLGHIRKIDTIASSLLEVVVDNQEGIRQALDKALKNGNLRALKEISQSIQMLMDVRERLLGFDETRQMQSKKKLRLQVVWKGTDGTSGGVNIEA